MAHFRIDCLVDSARLVLCSDVSDNRLASIPSTVGDLHALNKLNLSHNMLQSLPATLGGLTRLWGLWASHNLLERLPATIGELDKYCAVDVSNNRLKSLPDTISGLCDLDASFNALTALPAFRNKPSCYLTL